MPPPGGKDRCVGGVPFSEGYLGLSNPVWLGNTMSCSCHSWACSQERKTFLPCDEKQDSKWWSLGVTGFSELFSVARDVGYEVHSESAGVPPCTLSAQLHHHGSTLTGPPPSSCLQDPPGLADLFSLAWVPVTQGTRHALGAFLGFSLSWRKRWGWEERG